MGVSLHMGFPESVGVCVIYVSLSAQLSRIQSGRGGGGGAEERKEVRVQHMYTQ